LGEASPELAAEDAVETVVIRTSGDKIQDRPLAEIGGKGLFTKEIEEALLDRRIDVAVHSMKDVPTWLPEGLAITVILPREDPRDAFFAAEGAGLFDLPAGAVIGTGSLRRQAQVLAVRPDLRVVPLRGNVETRLRKLAEGQCDATLLAVAGLRRLGEGERITKVLAPEEMLPAAAQGAIGLEARSDDEATARRIEALNHLPSATRVAAERACLEVLDGSCRTPIGALAELTSEGSLRFRALVALPDGSRIYRAETVGDASEPERLGREVGASLRAQAGAEFFAALGAA